MRRGPSAREMRNPKFALDLNPARRDQRGEGGAKFAAGGELVVRATAEGLGGIVAAQQPDRPGFRRLGREPREIGQRADRRMAGAEHGDGLAGIARAILAQHIRHAVGDPVRRLRLADGAQAVGACRIRRMPGAGRVDHGVGPHDLGALPVLIADLERGCFPALALELVEADAADVGDAARRMDVARERGLGRERFEIALHQFGAGRILARARENSSRLRRAGVPRRGRRCIPTARTAAHGPIAAPRGRRGCRLPARSASARAPAHARPRQGRPGRLR